MSDAITVILHDRGALTDQVLRSMIGYAVRVTWAPAGPAWKLPRPRADTGTLLSVDQDHIVLADENEERMELTASAVRKVELL